MDNPNNISCGFCNLPLGLAKPDSHIKITNKKNSMITTEEKDIILAEIKAGRFEYRKALHEEAIKEMNLDGLLNVSRTKDGTDVDLTSKGKTFISEGGYTELEKEKNKEKRKEYIMRALFFVLGAVVVKTIDILLPRLLS